MIIYEIHRYTLIYFISPKSAVNTVFSPFYNLKKRQFSAKIKKLKTDKGGEYVNIVMTTFLEISWIIHDLSPRYIHESNCLPELMNCTTVMMVISMMLNCTNMISQALWTELCSTAVYIKHCLPHSAFKKTKCP
jgi:hypothetical protein